MSIRMFMFLISKQKTHPQLYIPTIVRFVVTQTDRQTDRYFIDRKKVNPDLFVIENRDMYMYIQHC